MNMNKDTHELTAAEKLFIETHSPTRLLDDLNKDLLDHFGHFDALVMADITDYISEWAERRS